MSRHQTLVTLTGTHVGESTKAVRFRVDSISGVELEKTVVEWFPFSQVEKMTTDKNTEGQDTLVVSEWICKQKGLM